MKIYINLCSGILVVFRVCGLYPVQMDTVHSEFLWLFVLARSVDQSLLLHMERPQELTASLLAQPGLYNQNQIDFIKNKKCADLIKYV